MIMGAQKHGPQYKKKALQTNGGEGQENLSNETFGLIHVFPSLFF